MPHKRPQIDSYIKNNYDLTGARHYLNDLIKYHITDKDGEILRLTKEGNGKLVSDFDNKKKIALAHLDEIIKKGNKSIQKLTKQRKDDYTEFAVYTYKLPNSEGKYIRCKLKAGRKRIKGLNPYYLVADNKKKELSLSARCAETKELSSSPSGAQNEAIASADLSSSLSYDSSIEDFYEIVNVEAEEIEDKEGNDNALDEMADRICGRIAEKFRAKEQAAYAVIPLLGDISPYAYDSAEDIYKEALNRAGWDTSQYPKAAYKGMAEALLRVRGLS
jgi:hypothetical protein